MRIFNRVVIVAATGTFIDVLDLTMFQNVRVPSLRALGVPEDQLFGSGVTLLNVQLVGMLVGGVLWGSLADRRGRKAVLFASILCYSLATLASGAVGALPAYAVARLIAGFGLAGEFGAGIALIAEVMPPDKRGYGTAICAAFGALGAFGGAALASFFSWRMAYLVGGIAGLVLLAVRARTFESGLFEKSREKAEIRRGFIALLGHRSRLWRYALSLAISLPLFWVIQSVVPFTPELAASLRPPREIAVPVATAVGGAGVAIGDIANGLLSQRLHSRKRPMLYAILLIAASMLLVLCVPLPSNGTLVFLLFALGFGSGYYVQFLTSAAEQFGTNVRGSATVIAPNIMRAFVIPMTLSFRGLGGRFGLRTSALTITVVCVGIALVALGALPETFGRNLDFEE